jgi:single-stranded DNA-binding protein
MKLALDVNRMSSFAVSAVGYLARSPERVVTEGGSYCRFCLTSEDYTEDDDQGRFTLVVQSVWFVATHLVGAAIADSARKGDQLFVEGKIRRKHWTAKGRDEDTTFVVTGFRFGQRRRGLAAESEADFGRAPIARRHSAPLVSGVASAALPAHPLDQ